MIHAANAAKSERLKRVLKLLRTGDYTTRGIIRKANVCAVPAIKAELRANGFNVTCKPVARGRYLYHLEKSKT